MCKVYCWCCGDETPGLSIENAEYFYMLWGEIKLPVCDYCYKYTGIEIEKFKWELISRMHGKSNHLAQQKIKEDLENEDKTKEG